MTNEQKLKKLLLEQARLLKKLDKATKELNKSLDQIIEVCDFFIKSPYQLLESRGSYEK